MFVYSSLLISICLNVVHVSEHLLLCLLYAVVLNLIVWMIMVFAIGLGRFLVLKKRLVLLRQKYQTFDL